MSQSSLMPPILVFTIPEIADLLGLKERETRDKAKRHNWQPTGERVQGGGDKYNINEIIFYKSPKKHEAAKNKVKANIKAKDTAERSTAVHKKLKALEPQEREFIAALELTLDDREELWRPFANKKPKQRDKALIRVQAVNAYWTRRHEFGMSEQDAVEETAKEFGVHSQSVRGWVKKAAGVNQADRAAVLVNQVQGNRNTAEFTPEAWTAFKKDFLRRKRPSISSCYRRLESAASQNGWIIPIKKTVENWIKRNIDPMVVKYRREGMEAVERCYPAMKRNKEMFDVLEAVNGDGFQLGIWADFGNGVVIKPVVWSWQDIRSSKVLSWRMDVSENRELLRLATLDLITAWGIPKYFYLDNTRAAASKQISGGLPNRYRFKVKDDDPLGIILLIGATLKYTLPAHGQSKPIERIHGIGGYLDFDSLPTFEGRGTKARPIPIDELEEIFRSFVNEINARQDRRGDAVRGKSFDQVFNELYPEAIITKATERQRKYCMCVAEVVTVSSTDASITLKAGKASFGENRYWHEALTSYMGQKVTVRFDPADMHGGVYVESINGTEICFATATITGGFKDADSAREVARARGHFKKTTRLAAEAEAKYTAAEARSNNPVIPEPEKPQSGKVLRMLTGVSTGHEMAPKKVVNGDCDGPTEEMQNNFSMMTKKLLEERKNSI